MKLTIPLTHRGENHTITTAPVDVVAFERAFGMGMGKAFTKVDDLHLEYQSWIAWHAMKRQGKTSEDFEAWLNGLEQIFDEPEVAAAPLDETAFTG